MPGQVTGSLVAATFGLIYVFVNSAALADSVAQPLRGLAVVVFALVVATAGRSRSHSAEERTTGYPLYRSAFWGVVAAESIALMAGVVVLNRWFEELHAGVAWVSIVVGVHFFALAVVFKQRFFNVLGVAITCCGVVAMALAIGGSGAATVAAVGGVVPGGVLLASGWWGVLRRTPEEPGGHAEHGGDRRPHERQRHAAGPEPRE
ncbi:MAG TPA: hypothetical protein VFG72_11610 [Marmoricola sp.]|nr:hypothetical protein [Marmoricola sp.]